MKFRIAAIGLICLILTSCATIFNSRTRQLKIITNSPAVVVLNGDTIRNRNNQTQITVQRQRAPLDLTVFNDSITKHLTIRSKNSIAYWANFTCPYGLGMLVDMRNPKRYTYPGTIYIDMRNSDHRYAKIDSATIRNGDLIKITPLKMIDLSNPGFELSYERKTGNGFSTQFMASYLFPDRVWKGGYGKPDIKGFRMAIEERWYFAKKPPLGLYIAVEFNYMKNQYRDVGNFGPENIPDSVYTFTGYIEEYGIKKQTFSINPKFGYQFFVNKTSIDLYAGIGLRYRDVRHFDRINPDDVMQVPFYPNIYYFANIEGRNWTLSVPLNIRIGWVF